MNVKKHLPILATIVFCLLAIVVFRVILPFSHTFTPNGTQLNTVDAYYQIRYADTYPNIPSHDYFINYPDGVDTHIGLWPKLLGFLSLLFHTSASNAGAILPPILFVLTLLPVYVISRLLFKNKYVPLVAMVIYSILAGDVLDRTMLGAADTHCWEMFLFSYLVMFCFLAIRYIKEWKSVIGSIVCIALFGVLYAMSWNGWPLIAFIVGIFLLVMGMVKFSEPNKILLGYGVIVAVLTIYLFMPTQFMNYWRMLEAMFKIIPSQPIAEEYSLFFTSGQFDQSSLWNYFGITFYLMLAGLGMILYRVARYRRGLDMFFVICLGTLLGLTVAMRRFDYYLAAGVAILSAYVVVFFANYIISRYKNYAIVLILAFALVAVPLIRVDYIQSSRDINVMPKDWREITQWLENKSNVIDYKIGFTRSNAVLTWMDYSYWVLGASHMPVMDTTGYSSDESSRMFISTDYDKTLEQIKSLGFKYVVIDEDMVTKKVYDVFAYTGYKQELTWEDVRRTFMYQLFYEGIDGFTVVYCSGDNKVKVFEVK